MKSNVKKVLHWITSLKVAVVILALIALYIIIGTLLPQHGNQQWYIENYPKLGKLIVSLSLNNAYGSPIFLILVALFTLNLTGCTVISLKGQLRQLDRSFFPSFTQEEPIENIDKNIMSIFLKKGFYKISDEKPLKAAKFRWGVLGAAITHLGLIILFLGGTIGNMSSTEQQITLLPQNQYYFEKEGFLLTLDDFYITFDEQGAVKQYISELTLTDDNGKITSKKIWVNNPLKHKGLGIYQANYNWASNLRITDLENNEIIAQGLLRNGRSYFNQEHHLTVNLFKYFPDFAIGHNEQPVTISEREENPHYIVILSEYGNLIDYYIVAPNEKIIYKDLEIVFTHSELYTGLLVRSDPSYPIALLGFLIIILGMFVSFYCYPRFIMFSDNKVYTFSRRNGWAYNQSVRSALNRYQKKE